MLDPSLSRIAVFGVCVLICFLAYVSQYYLLYTRFSRNESIFFNTLVAFIWITYARTIYTDPGSPPKDYAPTELGGLDAEEGRGRGESRRLVAAAGKWCRKCESVKPVRCHHCKTCKRCILRMDHHCPWTANCVGFRNFPHFFRFLFYTAFTTCYLLYHLIDLCYEVYLARDLPSYLSEITPSEILLIFSLVFVDTMTAFALTILFFRTLVQTSEGFTTIETFEKERHDALVRRKAVKRQTFPYDIGVYANISCAMANAWFVLWWFPLYPSPTIGKILKGGEHGDLELKGGLEWEVNGFEPPQRTWPPPDPDKVPMVGRAIAEEKSDAFTVDGVTDVEAFRRRQTEDLKRWERTSTHSPTNSFSTSSAVYLTGPLQRPPSQKIQKESNLFADSDSEENYDDEDSGAATVAPQMGVPWRNEEGETLADYGVDEEAEQEDDDIPLAELLRRRRERKMK
ncbi:Palmitoyltransferase [Rhizina undulata]